MNLEEFINYLIMIKEEYNIGDYEVRIGYRDDGGYYEGSDDLIEENILIYKNNKIIEL